MTTATWGIEQGLPPNLAAYLTQHNGAYLLAAELPDAFPANLIPPDSDEAKQTWNKAQEAWAAAGEFYLRLNRFHEAASIFNSLYLHIVRAQKSDNRRYHKGWPLVWLSDCYARRGYEVIAQRYLMLALIEDAIEDRGIVQTEDRGVYFRFLWSGWLSQSAITQYATRATEFARANKGASAYPERVLQELDQNWMAGVPTATEAGIFLANTEYIRHLIANLGDLSGRTLELLAGYLMSCMPGCRTQLRLKSPSTDYDVICSIDGVESDFRSEFGRYFLCECKDWELSADFSAMAKFCRVLDSVKSRFGIVFSKNGISGEGNSRDAEREQLKFYQDKGVVIVVVSQADLKELANGTNFLSMLRSKYERVRLDLSVPRRSNRRPSKAPHRRGRARS